MDLTKKEIKILQEQLILIYKLINQDKTFKSFYFKGINIDKQLKNKSHIINELNRLKDPEITLRSCIVELEEIKKNKSSINNKVFHEIIKKYSLMDLKNKYNIKNMEDIDKLSIKNLLEQL